MRTLISLVLLVGVIGCTNKPSTLATGQPSFDVSGFDGLYLGAPIEEGSLLLVPVSTRKLQQDTDEYVTLEQAKKNGWIEIIEVPGQEQVETLKIRYSGPQPMILFAGELLLGGKQDRVVAKDTIIKPNETADVMVFCVEPGRWSGESMHFDAQDAQVPLSVKEQAILGGQQEVWNEVGGYNRRMAPEAEGTSLRYGFKKVQESTEYKEGLDRVLKALRIRKDVVGVVIVLGGKVHSFEYFQSPTMFENAAESVLRGAVASSITEAGKGDKPQMSVVADFVSRSLKSAQERKFERGQSNAKIDAMATSGIAGAVSNKPDDGQVIHGSFYEKKK